MHASTAAGEETHTHVCRVNTPAQLQGNTLAGVQSTHARVYTALRYSVPWLHCSCLGMHASVSPAHAPWTERRKSTMSQHALSITDETFGALVRTHRDALGLTQQSLARACQLSPVSISQNK